MLVTQVERLVGFWETREARETLELKEVNYAYTNVAEKNDWIELEQINDWGYTINVHHLEHSIQIVLFHANIEGDKICLTHILPKT